MPKIPYLTILTILLLLATCANSANWSRLITTQNRDDVVISFQQQRDNNAWSVQWQVKNSSKDKIAAILTTRNYTCVDKSFQQLGKKTLGIYLPDSQSYVASKDNGICPNSKIKLVEIETVIYEVGNDE
ncbi:hypothetical protein MNBD_GAMMA01-1946 [hydrothermal vent metagenome]|uniref:Uncharacterized protein n=1 Tax=hydrothermal vent metagenome TaxID=652676 RepID=A0A3B0WAY3_9ZZZZ